MNELIKITEKNGVKLVSARELYVFLEVSERFSRFMERNLEYGFEEGVDYTPYQNVHPQNNQEFTDYALTLDCAKEISMLQRTESGKIARKYFIDCEKRLLAPKLSTKELLIIALQEVNEEKELLSKKLESANSKIEVDRPKVVFADSVIGSSNSILVRQFAKDLCEQGFDIGQNRLYDWFRVNKYLNDNNEPYQQYVSMGLFEVITRSIGSGEETFTTKTTKITGKGAVYFAEKLKTRNLLKLN